MTRVRNVEILADAPTKNRLPVRLDLDVQGIGAWTQEVAVYVPTAEQMAEHAKRLADMPRLAEAEAGPCSARCYEREPRGFATVFRRADSRRLQGIADVLGLNVCQ